MKRIVLATGLGLGLLTFTMAGATNHSTAPVGQMTSDTIPSDTTTKPSPMPDSLTISDFR